MILKDFKANMLMVLGILVLLVTTVNSTVQQNFNQYQVIYVTEQFLQDQATIYTNKGLIKTDRNILVQQKQDGQSDVPILSGIDPCQEFGKMHVVQEKYIELADILTGIQFSHSLQKTLIKYQKMTKIHEQIKINTKLATTGAKMIQPKLTQLMNFDSAYVQQLTQQLGCNFYEDSRKTAQDIINQIIKNGNGQFNAIYIGFENEVKVQVRAYLEKIPEYLNTLQKMNIVDEKDTKGMRAILISVLQNDANLIPYILQGIIQPGQLPVETTQQKESNKSLFHTELIFMYQQAEIFPQICFYTRKDMCEHCRTRIGRFMQAKKQAAVILSQDQYTPPKELQKNPTKVDLEMKMDSGKFKMTRSTTQEQIEDGEEIQLELPYVCQIRIPNLGSEDFVAHPFRVEFSKDGKTAKISLEKKEEKTE